MKITYIFDFQLTPIELAIIETSGVLPTPGGVQALVLQNAGPNATVPVLPVPPPFSLPLPMLAPITGGLLWDDVGVLSVSFGITDPASLAWVIALPTSLPALGLLWNNGGIITISGVVSSSTPSWVASLPHSLPITPEQLWIDGYVIAIS